MKAIATHLSRPSVQILAGISSFAAGLFGPQLIGYARDFKDYFDSQRASSSNLRELLQRMALYQWQEAPIWGHGIKAPRGPAVTNFMPVGSHHTWLGLLYVHGIVGFIALALAMLYSFIELLIKAQKSKAAQTGLAVLLVLILFSLGENLETLAYLYWPGLLMLGIAFKEPFPALFAHFKPQFNQSQA
ncbi:MAG: O-antigen ligase family protein [Leptolyngbyaceae cyanobacterium SL_5_9]|nr:O-antigen ligase family protein [Leptolyngbyaceae cyanobacterium SL_5_9]